MTTETIDRETVNQHNAPGDLLSLLPLSPEERFVITMAKVTLSGAEVARLRDEASAVSNWEGVVSFAGRQRVAGLLARHINREELAGIVPAEILSRLQDIHRYYIARQLYFRSELRKILKVMDEHGIPVILLKGTALLEMVYTQAGLRPMSDMDVLVPAESAQQAQKLVLNLGYSAGGSPEDHADTEQNHRHLPILLGDGKPTAVEVHRHVVRLDSPLHFDISAFWRDSRTASISGVPVRLLSPEHSIIHGCLAFFMDRRYRSGAALGQLVDVAELSKRFQNELEWDSLVEDARSFGLAGPVAVSLRLAAGLLEAPVPDSVVQRLRPSGMNHEDLARFAMLRVVSHEEEFVARELVPPGKQYGLTGMARGMFRRLVPSRRYLVNKYGDSARGWLGGRMYIARWVEGVLLMAKFVRHPRALQQDLAVDRWLHSLYENGSRVKGRTQD